MQNLNKVKQFLDENDYEYEEWTIGMWSADIFVPAIFIKFPYFDEDGGNTQEQRRNFEKYIRSHKPLYMKERSITSDYVSFLVYDSKEMYDEYQAKENAKLAEIEEFYQKKHAENLAAEQHIA